MIQKRWSIITLGFVPKILTYKVVVLARLELETARLWREGPERDRHEIEQVWLVADGDDARIRVGDATRLVLDLGDVVDDVLFRFVLVGVAIVERTQDVHLIVLKVEISVVHVDDVVVVVYPKAVGEKRWGKHY
jgi:hypothetical protein